MLSMNDNARFQFISIGQLIFENEITMKENVMKKNALIIAFAIVIFIQKFIQTIAHKTASPLD